MDLTNDALADMAVSESALVTSMVDNEEIEDTTTTMDMAKSYHAANRCEPTLLTESSYGTIRDDPSPTLVWDILHHGRWAFCTASLCLVALWIYCTVSGPLLTGANHYHWISQKTYEALAVPSLALWILGLGCGILLVPMTGCFVWVHMMCTSPSASPQVRSLLEESQLGDVL